MILLGYSPVLFELLIQITRLKNDNFTLIEDKVSKVKLIKSYNLELLNIMDSAKGKIFILNNLNDAKIYIGVSSSPKKRLEIFKNFKFKKVLYPTINQNSAKISSFAKLSNYGVYLGDYTTIEPNSEIDEFCFIQSHSHVGHDSQIGKFCIFGGNVTINGNCKIDPFCLIGSSVTVLNGITIGTGSVIQAGTTITGDIPPFSFVSGNPCKILPVEILGKDYSIPRKVIKK